MSHLPSLPEDATLLDVFRAYPDTARPLLDYHETLMRGPSPLTIAERELVAAYVSGLNGCGYFGVRPVATRRWDAEIVSVPPSPQVTVIAAAFPSTLVHGVESRTSIPSARKPCRTAADTSASPPPGACRHVVRA